MIAIRSGVENHEEVPELSPAKDVPLSRFQLITTDPQVSELLRLVREWPGEPPTIKELCKKLSISRRSLERRFRMALGRSPMEEIRRQNLKRAAELLLESTMPIKSIAFTCGFSSLVHLSVAFRRGYGVSPRGFRRNGRATAQSTLSSSDSAAAG
jgi:transcriptional regulator GlxA family with amidase domain